ncbi:MAG: hypothetical protein K0R25_933 [Rickettsiaceae bacterium]|jgi:glycosyltransferase involved in cell wall biosynthesis|nr:hypothetical protein [Rickettsiaceae bacterium]
MLDLKVSLRENKKIPKLLFDMNQFQHFGGSDRTGIYRTADEIFKRLAKSNKIDLYCFIDRRKNYKKIINYLKHTDPSYLYKIVNFEYLSKTTRGKNLIFKIKSKIYSALYNKKYTSIINDYDWYFSPADPIPELVQNNIKTSALIHDIIPIIHPELCGQEKHEEFVKFIDNLKADFIFFNSECSRNDFLNYRKDYDLNKTTVTLLAAEKEFKPINDQNLIRQVREKYNIKTEKYFLSVSDLNPRKNLLFIIKNFLRFIKDNQVEDLCLVLSGPNKQFGQNLLAILSEYQNLFDKIIFTGFIDDGDLPSLYEGSMAFVYVSLYEGFGLPPLEAMQCGTPVIASNSSSLPEVVGEAGILVNPKNDQELIQSFQIIYNDQSVRAGLSKKGLERAKSFSWDGVIETLLNLYWQNSKIT